MKCTLKKILFTIKAQVHKGVAIVSCTFKCLFLIIVFMHTGTLTGFIDIGDVNNHLLEYQMSINNSNSVTSKPVLANSMLVFMVRGLLSNLEYPYAQFPCASLTGEQMFLPFWDAVSRLERCGFKVLAVTADGLSVNRHFFKLHGEESLVYKALNPYADEQRYIYFISDPPHLIKTVRNCWANKKRNLWVHVRSFLKLITMGPVRACHLNPNVIRQL